MEGGEQGGGDAVRECQAIRLLFDVVGPWRDGYTAAECVNGNGDDEYGCTYNLKGLFAFAMIVSPDTAGNWYVDSVFLGD